MMPEEYNTVDLRLMNQVAKKWMNRRIQFQITGCSIWWHEDKTGAQMWLLGFNIFSEDICELRTDLRLKDNKIFVSDMSVLENVVGYK